MTVFQPRLAWRCASAGAAVNRSLQMFDWTLVGIFVGSTWPIPSLQPAAAMPFRASEFDTRSMNSAPSWAGLRPVLRISAWQAGRSEEHTSELQSRLHLVC